MDALAIVHGVTALAMVGLVGLELRDARFRADSFGPGPRRPRNWAFLAAGLLPLVLVPSVARWFQAHLPTLLRPGAMPFLLDLPACTLTAELLTWLLHWAKHRQPYLWRFHFQHHREEHFSLWMVAHTHALEVFVSGTAMVAVLAAIGFAPLAVTLYLAFYSVVLMYHHSARDYSLGWLDRIVTSPAYHRRHHWQGAVGNYSGALTVWDIVFGTAHWPEPATHDVPVGLPPDAPEPFGFRREMLYFLSGRRRSRP